MFQTLAGLQVAILVNDGFSQLELTVPRTALERAGASTYIVSPAQVTVQSSPDSKQPQEFLVDVTLSEADADDFDILLVPGGVGHPDRLGRNQRVLQFVHAFFEGGKPVAKIFYTSRWWWITVWTMTTGAMTYRLATGMVE